MNVGHRIHWALFALSASTALLASRPAAAELVVYDKDGWTLKHDGLAQGFYMLTIGDAAPDAGPQAIDSNWGGYDAGSPDADGKAFNSRFRSGWTGGRFNWTAAKQMSPDTVASATLGVAYSISTHNAPTNSGGSWDVRNGFLKVAAPWGEVQVGRSVGLYTLGSIISTINMTSAALGVGNTCGAGGDGLSCYTSGYGVKFPGFWAGLFYTSPNLSGLTIKVAALDPKRGGAQANASSPANAAIPVSTLYNRTPLPMFQTMIRYEGDLGSVKLVPYFNGFWQQVGLAGSNENLNPMGGGGGVDLMLDMFKIGAGGTLENGSSMYGPLYGPDAIDGTGELRKGASFFLHAKLTLGQFDINAGYGRVGISRSDFDELNNLNVNKMQSNIYGGLQYHIDPLTLVAELNVLKHEWHEGNEQNVQVISLGADFAY